MVVRYSISKRRVKARTSEQIALDVAFRKRLNKIRKRFGDCHENDADSGVVFLSNLPHHFCERPMFNYFSQFGRIKRVRLSRSKKSAKSKGYAYIEFEYAEVAKIAAETLNNYLMYRKLIKCKVVPKEELHPDTFKGCFRKFGKPRGRMNSIRRNNSYVNADTKRVCRTLKRKAKQENKKEKLLKEMGIDFKIDGYRTEWNAAKDVLAKRGKSTKTQKGESDVDEVVDSKLTEEIITDNVVEETGSKETEESSSADVPKKSPRRTRSKGRTATMSENSDVEHLKKNAVESNEKISEVTVGSEEQGSKKAKKSLPEDVGQSLPRRKSRRSMKGAKNEKPEEGKSPADKYTAPVSRSMTQKRTLKDGQEKTPIKDTITPKTRRSNIKK